LDVEKIKREPGIGPSVFNKKTKLFRKIEDYEKLIEKESYSSGSHLYYIQEFLKSYKSSNYHDQTYINEAQKRLELHYDQNRKDFFKEYEFTGNIKNFIEDNNKQQKIDLLKQYFRKTQPSLRVENAF
jgi:hypothetical protein